MGDTRFLGTRLDDEIVLLDRERGRLVRLNPGAARVWEVCAGSERTGTIPAAALSGSYARRILRGLSQAGVIQEVDGRWVAMPIRWV